MFNRDLFVCRTSSTYKMDSAMTGPKMFNSSFKPVFLTYCLFLNRKLVNGS